jgi:2-dehydropantoate 2-reductase
MKFAIVGAGGVGGYLGARLIKAGRDVAFVARGANLEALRKTGLRLKSTLGDLELGPVRAESDPAVIGPVDAVFFTTKLYDLAEVAKRAAPLFGAETVAVPVQNGVEAHDIIAKALPTARVLKATIYISSFLVGPAQYLHVSPFCRLRFAAANPADGAAADGLAAALKGVHGIDAAVSPTIDTDLWRKMVMLASFSAIACLRRAPVGGVLDDPGSFALFRKAIAETVAVARASKIDLPDDIEAATIAQTRQFPATAKPSMLEDLEAGRPLELHYLSGAVSRFGKALGVPTPTHDTAVKELTPFAAGKPR